ncbi:hypothetical protein C0993_011135 [Termitomyces sp. T159_Od127]|nr:hypothetical protein C0993_011135 [Termitomyces sp. T159_Od127]
MATMILDDASFMFVFVPPAETAQDKSYFGGSISALNVKGTSITFFGYLALNFSAILRTDKEKESEIQFVSHGQNQSGLIIDAIFHWRSPDLSDSAQEHSLDFFIPSNISDTTIFDYAVVSVTENTLINGERLIVDESDPSVVFEGDWALYTSILGNSTTEATLRRPFGKTIHQTSSDHASATFRFNGLCSSGYFLCQHDQLQNVTGTSVSVFGAKLLGPSQALQVLYTIDELETASQMEAYSPGNPAGNSTNFQWYQRDGLSPTTHTLNITLLDVLSDASFNLDYFLYIPSFSSLAEEKGFTKQQASSSISQPSSHATSPQVSIVPPPDHPSISLEAFPPNWNPSSSNQPMVQQKPPLPSTLYAERQALRQSVTSSTNETIVADTRVQQLEELVVSLQREIEETRQVYGAQNGALMRDLVEGHSESSNQHSQQENNHVSLGEMGILLEF